MKVIVFGVGNYYQSKKNSIKTFLDIEIICFVDNDPQLWGKKIDGILVEKPDKILMLQYEKIMIMSENIYAEEMYEQLIGMGIDKEKIITWRRYCSQYTREKGRIYYAEDTRTEEKKKLLIISTDLEYNGGSIVPIYAAKVLKNMAVVLAVPRANEILLEEVLSEKISVAICPTLPYLYEEEKEWIKEFDIVMVNVFQMIECACEVSRIRPTFWWIHEPSVYYDEKIYYYPGYMNADKMADINIYAVSKIARDNFNAVFTDRTKGIMPYGIPDMAPDELVRKKEGGTVFAIIGDVQELKAQDIFLKAAALVGNSSKAEFWIIGKWSDSDYCREVREIACNVDNARILGELSRKEIYEVFEKIDVVVCASQEETLSIAVTEAMMFGKVSITTNTTGIIDYIQNGKNGFIIPKNDIEALKEKMEWILQNQDKFDEIGKAARETYEKYFSMEVFEKNIKKALQETEDNWKRK